MDMDCIHDLRRWKLAVREGKWAGSGAEGQGIAPLAAMNTDVGGRLEVQVQVWVQVLCHHDHDLGSCRGRGQVAVIVRAWPLIQPKTTWQDRGGMGHAAHLHLGRLRLRGRLGFGVVIWTPGCLASI